MENFAVSVCTHYPFHVQFSACISRFRLSAISFINKVPGRFHDADRGFDTLAIVREMPAVERNDDADFISER